MTSKVGDVLEGLTRRVENIEKASESTIVNDTNTNKDINTNPGKSIDNGTSAMSKSKGDSNNKRKNIKQDIQNMRKNHKKNNNSQGI